MAVAAVQAELIGVNRMGKSHLLNRLITDACVFWREVIPHPRRHCSSNQHRSHGDLERKPVRPLWENVRHLYSVPTGSQAAECSRATRQELSRRFLTYRRLAVGRASSIATRGGLQLRDGQTACPR